MENKNINEKIEMSVTRTITEHGRVIVSFNLHNMKKDLFDLISIIPKRHGDNSVHCFRTKDIQIGDTSINFFSDGD